MKPFKLSIVLLILLQIIGFSFATETPKTVEGIGIAAGKGSAAHEEALARALRNAVERAVGVLVSSESLVKNFQLLEDHIYSQVRGYVQDYEITEDNKGENDLTRIKVKATVLKDSLESDLRGIKVIMEAKGNPKTMVTIDETLDGQISTMSNVGIQIEEFLSSKSFTVIDSGQLEQIKARDSIVFDDNPETAKILGAKLGAELIITGEAKSTLASEVEAYGVPVFAYSGVLTLKAIQSDTGAILATLQGNEIGRSGSPDQAAQEAFKLIWDNNKKEFLKKILEKWRSQVLNTTEIAIHIAGLDPNNRAEIIAKIKGLQGVRSLNEKGFQSGLMELSLQVDGAAVKNLEQKIVESIPELLLTSKSSHRLDFEIKSMEMK